MRLHRSPLCVAALAFTACAAPESTQNLDTCASEKCDDVDDIDEDGERSSAACDGRMVDKSGRQLGDAFASSLHDPIAVHAFSAGERCPTTAAEVREKLQAAGCSLGGTSFISEAAAITRQEDTYRSVTDLRCDGQRVFFSMFGIRPGSEVPEDAEMLAMDPERGAFNYYEVKDGRIEFFGSSDEFVALGQGEDDTRRCAACHTGGGLVMKELRAPWQHWQSPDFDDLPGSSQLIEEHPEDFGFLTEADLLEELVVEQNRVWGELRLLHLLEGMDEDMSSPDHTELADVIRPVFCSSEVMIHSGFGRSTGIALRGLVYPEQLGFFGGSIEYSEADYDAVTRVLFNQRMAIDGFFETQGQGTTVDRAAAESEFIDTLVFQGVLDREFVEDVMLVDMTRPLFSPDRCELLKFAPDLSSDELAPQTIRAGFIANLEAASPAPGSPAADLLRNFRDDADDGEATARRLAQACEQRSTTEEQIEVEMPDGVFLPVDRVVRDVLLVSSIARSHADELPVFEFPGLSMPLDRPPVPEELSANSLEGVRLHPETCQLTREYTSFEPVRD